MRGAVIEFSLPVYYVVFGVSHFEHLELLGVLRGVYTKDQSLWSNRDLSKSFEVPATAQPAPEQILHRTLDDAMLGANDDRDEAELASHDALRAG
jgi:hypothetical protein